MTTGYVSGNSSFVWIKNNLVFN